MKNKENINTENLIYIIGNKELEKEYDSQNFLLNYIGEVSNNVSDLQVVDEDKNLFILDKIISGIFDQDNKRTYFDVLTTTNERKVIMFESPNYNLDNLEEAMNLRSTLDIDPNGIYRLIMPN